MSVIEQTIGLLLNEVDASLQAYNYDRLEKYLRAVLEYVIREWEEVRGYPDIYKLRNVIDMYMDRLVRQREPIGDVSIAYSHLICLIESNDPDSA